MSKHRPQEDSALVRSLKAILFLVLLALFLNYNVISYYPAGSFISSILWLPGKNLQKNQKGDFMISVSAFFTAEQNVQIKLYVTGLCEIKRNRPFPHRL